MLEWSKIFNLLGIALIVISLYKFAGDTMVKVLRGAVALIGIIMLLRNYDDATNTLMVISSQWWPVLKNLAISSSQSFANLISSLSN